MEGERVCEGQMEYSERGFVKVTEHTSLMGARGAAAALGLGEDWRW